MEAYLLFRQELEQADNAPKDGGPQLIIMGHGSVDDPDGTVIYEELHDTLASRDYALVKKDVCIVRAPPSDSILGCILQGAWVATQLSTREGFEVKVTEAINKRVPIIASSAGGIPLQVKHGLNGWVVPTSDTKAIASLLIDIHSGKERVHRAIPSSRTVDGNSDPNSVAQAFVNDYEMPMVKVHADDGATSEDFWTVGNAARWMLLASRVLGLSPEAEGGGVGTEEVELLKSMEVGKKMSDKGIDGVNVWKMVMGSDMLEGEAEIRLEGA